MGMLQQSIESRPTLCKVIHNIPDGTLSFRNWGWTVLKPRSFGLQNRTCEALAHEHILQELSMPSPEIAQALLAPQTQKALSLPIAALIFGALSQVDTLMEIVDRVCDPYFSGGALKIASP